MVCRYVPKSYRTSVENRKLFIYSSTVGELVSLKKAQNGCTSTQQLFWCLVYFYAQALSNPRRNDRQSETVTISLREGSVEKVRRIKSRTDSKMSVEIIGQQKQEQKKKNEERFIMIKI